MPGIIHPLESQNLWDRLLTSGYWRAEGLFFTCQAKGPTEGHLELPELTHTQESVGAVTQTRRCMLRNEQGTNRGILTSQTRPVWLYI